MSFDKLAALYVWCANYQMGIHTIEGSVTVDSLQAAINYK